MKKVLNIFLSLTILYSLTSMSNIPLSSYSLGKNDKIPTREEVENTINLQQSLSLWRKQNDLTVKELEDLMKNMEEEMKTFKDLEKEFEDSLRGKSMPLPKPGDGKPEFLPNAPYQQKYHLTKYNKS